MGNVPVNMAVQDQVVNFTHRTLVSRGSIQCIFQTLQELK